MEEIVHVADVPVVERIHARAGRFRSQSLMQGHDGSPDNFFMQLSNTFDDFQSPRHRHNFDQIRIQLQGDADFARDGVMRPGSVAYFPEGVFYGPQSISGESLTLVLQFGGASGSGYVSEDRYQEAVAELKQSGSFENGIYRSTRDDGKPRNQDAYEAVWEHIHGRALVYPPSPFKQPAFLHPDDAMPQPGAEAGVRERVLGVFMPRGVRLRSLEIEAGATATLADHSITLVLDGQGTASEAAWARHSSLRTGAHTKAVTATRASRLIEMQLAPLTTV